MEILNVLVGAFGGAGAALAVAAFLGKQLVLNRFRRQLEEYKTELSNKSDRLRTDLSIYAHRQNTELSRLDAQRADAIEAMWSKFIEWNDAFEELTGRMHRELAKDAELISQSLDALQPYQTKVAELHAHSSDLSKEVRFRAIYFESNDYAPIVKCSSMISKLCSEFHKTHHDKYVDLKKIPTKEYVSGLLKACDKLRAEVFTDNEELRRTFVREFRKANASEGA